jgi:hypothetical protein
MQHTEVSKTDWELTVRAELVVEHKTMARAIHRLDTETLVFNFQQEKILLVFIVVT